MEVHYRDQGSGVRTRAVSAPCEYVFQPHLRGLDASYSWNPHAMYPVTCAKCIEHRPKKRRWPKMTLLPGKRVC